MSTDFKQIGQRIQWLRESCDVSREELAGELGVPVEEYIRYEETGANVPISAVYHIASKFGVDYTEIMTGGEARLDTYQVVKSGQGRDIDRYPGYRFQDLAWRFHDKIMQPLLVTLDPSDEPAALVQHPGQEFNMVLEGAITLTFENKEILLETGDCVYFNPALPHGQKCASSVPATFVTIIAE